MLDNRNVMYNGREWVVRVTFENGKVFDGATVIDFEISASQDTNQIIGATQGKQIELNLLSSSDTNLNGLFKVEVGEYYFDKKDNKYKTHWFNLGQHWKVESIEQRDSQSVTLTAVDPMVYLFSDDVYREGGSSENTTTSALIAHIQQKYGITIEGNIPNVSIINPYLEKYRDILSYLGIIGSSNCFFKANGMTLKYVPLIPKGTPDLAIDGQFYYNIEYDRSEFTVKKIALDTGDGFGYSRGEGSVDETITLKMPFATQEICDLIYNNLLNYTQEGIDCKFLAHPSLEPFDTLKLTDIYGAIHLTQINGYKLIFNGGLNMELATQIMSPSNTTTNYVEEKFRTKIKIEADRILSIVEAEYAKKENTLTVQASKENIRITLDEDMTPSKTENIAIEFKVYRNMTTEEVPCAIKSVALSDDNITASYTNTSNILTINANTDRVFTNTEGYIDVVIETTLGDIHKRLFWNATINAVLNSLVVLSASTTIFTKENSLGDFVPESITINANCSNCVLSRWLYSIDNARTFITTSNGNNGITISGNQLTIANNSILFDSTNNIVIKAESDDGVSDTVTIQRIEDVNSISVILDNENHSFEATSDGKAVATSINITVTAYKGITQEPITIGSISGIPTGMSAVIKNNVITITVNTSMITKNGMLNIPIICDGVTINKKFSYSLVIPGADGDDASYVNIMASNQVFLLDSKTSTYTPSSITLTPIWTNATYTKWQYSVDSGNTWNDVEHDYYGLTLSDDVLTMANTSRLFTDTVKSIQFKVIGSNDIYDTYDTITIIRVSNGENAVNVILSNEAHTFDANYEGYAISGSTSTKVYGYLGTTQKACTIGTISGLPTGMTAKINNNGTTTTSITFTVATTMTSRNGVVTIPVTCNGITVNKMFSYSLSLDGTPASSAKINAPASVFLSNDGGQTYSPTTITFTGSFIECAFSKWQYLDVNTSTFKNVVTGEHGFTLSGNNLILAVTSDLFNEKGGSISIRLLSNKSNIYDTLTISKLVQIKDIAQDIENIRSEIEQTNHSWKASFSTSNATNILFDGDFEKEISKCNFAKLNSSSIEPYYATVNGYPFYENHNSLNTAFKYNTLSGVVYSLDLSLKPDTDYVFQAYIYVDNANIVSTNSTSPLSYWTWTGETPKNDNTNTSSIIDYSQILYTGRYNLCYIHFKTKAIERQTIKCRLFIGSKSTSSGNQAVASIRQVCFRERDTVAPYTGNSNEIIAGITTIDMSGVTVEHTQVGTKTEMSADGFRIVDTEGENEVISEWSSKNFWSQFTVHEVFATNIENVYTGTESIFVLHSYTGVEMDGSSEKPFKSFADLQKALQKTPIINKDIKISVMTKDNCTETFALSNLKGSGKISILFSTGFIGRGGGTREAGIKLTNIQLPVTISGAGLFDQFVHGALFYNCMYVEIKDCIFNVPNYGCLFSNTNGLVNVVDFASSYCAIASERGSVVSCISASGNAGKSGTGECCRVMTGGIITLGKGSQGSVNIPTGTKSNQGGYINTAGTCNATTSWNYPTSKPIPTAPTTMSYTQSFNWTARGTYAYSWGSWSNNDCKQGAWNAGLRGGHLFFDMTAIRSFLSGTVLDGNTITLTRASNGGISGGANVFINGSSCSGTSGTPSYGNQTLLGTLAWGETKTFTLPKAIVQGLKNGSYNSLAVYVNSSAQNCYLNIVNASITVKVSK